MFCFFKENYLLTRSNRLLKLVSMHLLLQRKLFAYSKQLAFEFPSRNLLEFRNLLVISNYCLMSKLSLLFSGQRSKAS